MSIPVHHRDTCGVPLFWLTPSNALGNVLSCDMAWAMRADAKRFAINADNIDKTPTTMTSQKPICYGMVGVLHQGLQWLSNGRNFQVDEIACHAAGDEHCVFRIPKEPSK